MRIGIAAMGSKTGTNGGLDIYTRYLVDALATYGQCFTYIVLINEISMQSWSFRTWPAHIQFALLRDVEPQPSTMRRLKSRLSRLFGHSVPGYAGESYIARQIDALGLDLIHYPNTVISPLSIATPCVLGFWDMQHEYYPEFFTAQELDCRSKSYRVSVDKAIHVIAPSSYTQQCLIEKYHVPKSKVSILPHGIPDGFRQAGLDDINRIRVKYALPSEFLYFPANPWPHKNHARLMAAMRIYRERYGRIPKLVLSGRLINERRDAGILALAAGVEDCVLDLGFVPIEDIPSLYCAATAMIFPSVFEGFGIPLIEAMACGCPVAAANATSVPEIVGDAALLFDPFDSSAIADALHRICEDQGLRENLVRGGYAQVQQFDWMDIVLQLNEVYEQAYKLAKPR